MILSTDFGKLRLTLSDSLTPLPGDSIFWKSEWYPSRPPTVPGSFNAPQWLESAGLTAHGKMKSMEIFHSAWVPERSFLQFRRWIKSRLTARMSAAESGFILGLLAGDRSGIPEILQQDFRRTGLIHVLSISGFHVVLLSGILMLFLKATPLPHQAVRVCAILLLLIYIPVTGGSAPVTRAVFMFIVIQAAALFQRKTDGLNSLGVALLLICFFRPEELGNAGFQLSAAATAGIITGQKLYPLQRVSRKLKKHPWLSAPESFFLQSSWVTLTATVSTAPFLIYHFKSLSPVSLLGNIFVVPLISCAMQSGLFAVIIPSDIIRFLFADASAFFLRAAVWITSHLSESPGAMLTVGPFSLEILFLSTIPLLAVSSFSKNALSRRITLYSLISLCALFAYEQIKIKLKPEWSITVLDAGQADCIFIESPRKKAFLVDAGVNGKRDAAQDKIIPFLRSAGVVKLEALIITHPDADHFGGAKTLLKSFPVKELWISECARFDRKPEWIQVLSAALENKVPVRDLRRGLTFTEFSSLPGMKPSLWEMRFLHPDPKLCRGTNEESLVIHIRGAGGSALLAGDVTVLGESEILQTDIPVQSNFLKLGHHGSKTSNSEAFLKAVGPDFAAVSSGKNNRYRHPSKDVTERLRTLQIPWLNTASNGSIILRFREGTYSLECFPTNPRCFSEAGAPEIL
ncbi:MAG: DNA internalization-related competence protein ComEC/Rec2 [Fibrobacter sp.]|nr:DNA internalization-related competence protein ComEC/Rec2 [Fibrobacter sp.]